MKILTMKIVKLSEMYENDDIVEFGKNGWDL